MFDDIKSFIFANWRYIFITLLLIVDIIVCLTRKKVKVIDVMAIVLKRLPGYVLDAEATGLSGSSKYTEVFSRVVKDLVDLTGLSAEQVCSKYTGQIDDAIENNVKVLNDFKKGVNKNEKI